MREPGLGTDRIEQMRAAGVISPRSDNPPPERNDKGF
ncbi:hypothetical protein PS838_03725 [Pseudomonas fluorescens]|nr:hypothetical protein PS838_03725 [Pseudomonas fluorescens]